LALERKENRVELGMIGLGRMGTNMVRRLMRAGHECVVYDLHSDAVQALAEQFEEAPRHLDDGPGGSG
jgi:6-phosphogluconate dehydrogenase (decarboxylating)